MHCQCGHAPFMYGVNCEAQFYEARSLTRRVSRKFEPQQIPPLGNASKGADSLASAILSFCGF